MPHKMMHNSVSANQDIFSLHGYSRAAAHPCSPFCQTWKYPGINVYKIILFYHINIIYARTVSTDHSVGTEVFLWDFLYAFYCNLKRFCNDFKLHARFIRGLLREIGDMDEAGFCFGSVKAVKNGIDNVVADVSSCGI